MPDEGDSKASRSMIGKRNDRVDSLLGLRSAFAHLHSVLGNLIEVFRTSRWISYGGYVTLANSKGEFAMGYFSHSKWKLAFALTVMSAVSLYAASASADEVTKWNLITVNATKTGKLNSNLGSRVDAIEAIAVYDAVNAIKHFGSPYHYSSPAPSPASPEAAAAQAARDVLIHFFPGQQSALDASLASSLASIPNGEKKSNGQGVGRAAALDIIALRSNDRSGPDVPYPATGVTGVGQWRPTPPASTPGINSQWGSVTPFVLKSSREFLPPAPPSVGSHEYNDALTAVKNIGAATSAIRTADQTHIALFYTQDAELTINEAARILAEKHGTSLETNALVFALVDVAVADARVVIWEAKYTYKFWRPVTALNANPDGTVSNSYATWVPLIVTPPHPEYLSGHSVTVAAGAAILKKFYGDLNTMTLHTTTSGEAPRTVTSLGQLAEENGLSRIYGGIHYSFSNGRAQRVGREVAEATLKFGPHALKDH
jgi:hypothetical protein